jgi:twinkle protein
MDLSGFATTAAASREGIVLHPRHTEWIEARGISAELAEKFGLQTVDRDGGKWLSVPYVERGKVLNHKYRLTSEKRFQMDEGAPLCLWNHDCLLEQSEKPVVICEGEMDALSAISLGWRAVSVPNGAPANETEDVANARRYEFLWRAKDLLNQVKTFILATDSDGPGMALRADLISLLGADRCSFVEYPCGLKLEPLKDLNDVLQARGPEEVARVLNDAKPVPVQGLYRLGDFPDPGPVQTIPVGIEGMSDHLSIVLGTLTVLTGWAGQGKTSFTLAIVAHLLKHNIPVALGTFETMPRPILERKLRAAIIGCGEHSIPAPQIAEADRLIADNLSIIAQMVGEEQEMNLEDVLELARTAVQRDGAKVVILDPWNEIEHKRRRDESETEYIGRAIRALKHFMRQHNVAVWIVAHPRKPEDGGKLSTPGLYSISGSAHWANKADYGVIYSRPDKETNIARVTVTKVRMGLPGKEGEVELEYDWRISNYRPAHS